jgi:hypothetical protein
MTDIDDIASRALLHFGHPTQSWKAMEELAELLLALIRYRRTDTAEACEMAEAAIIDEIADCTIMTRQLRLMYGPKEVDDRIHYKLHRLAQRMGE